MMKKGLFALIVMIITLSISGISAHAAPFNVYTETSGYAAGIDNFLPTGYMGDYLDITMTDGASGAHSGSTCTYVDYTAAGSGGEGLTDGSGYHPLYWAGVYWQEPGNNWGDLDGGYDLTGSTVLSFFAKGVNGGEKVTFGAGGIGAPPPYGKGDTFSVNMPTQTLTTDWQQYTVDLSGLDMSHVIGGFKWAATRRDNPSGATFLLDDITYDVIPEPSSLILLGSGILGMLSFSRKKKKA
ncbi:MAG: hypothetical protein DRP78_06730 [Candidatus Omnitrophota bacterium]|nr:MAG: hypothetical protein DRP78_06730 [Candidatus Omnitrophota bacterium]